MKILSDGTSIIATETLVQIVGRTPSGKHGIWVIKRNLQIFACDNVLRFKRRSNASIVKQFRDI